MKMISPRALACMVVLLSGFSLSACSTLTNVSEAVSGAASSINPFQQQTETGVSEPAPANESVPLNAPPASIRVEAKPPQPKRQQDVEVNLGSNKQCTTFCALPTRKPSVN